MVKGVPPWTRSAARMVAKEPRTEGSLCSVRADVKHWLLLTPGWITHEGGSQLIESVLAITPPAEVQPIVVLSDQSVYD